MKKIIVCLIFCFFCSIVLASQIDKAEPTKAPSKYIVDPIKEIAFRRKEAILLKTIFQMNLRTNLNETEKILIQLRDDPDLVQVLGSYKSSAFGERGYFALAKCQEKSGKKKLALESYRAMYKSPWAEKHNELCMGFYALCALENGYFNEARTVAQECIDKMRNHPAYSQEYRYVTDIPIASDTNVICAHIYLLLSRGISYSNSIAEEKDDGGPKTQEYLKKAIKLGRGTTPNAYLRMAQYTRWSDPVQSRKYLEDLAKMYKKYPMHAEEARKRLKEYPPETEKTKE
jgi:hypothetical protein